MISRPGPLRCAAALVLGSLLALAGGASAVGLTPPVLLPGDGAIGPAADYQVAPAIAAGGSLSLVVWADLRATGSGGADIYAARLDANGALLDSIPIVVAQQAADQNMPRVAWNGQNWLVVWATQLPTDFYYELGIAAARVSPTGAVLDASPVILMHNVSSGAQIAVASLGTDWAVVAQGGAVDAGIVGARISAAGALLDPTPVTVIAATYFQRAHIELAGASDEYLLTWDDLNDFRGIRLHASLSPIEPASFDISGPLDASVDSRLATNGTDFFLVWEEAVFTTYEDYIKGARITHAGQVLDPGGIAITPNLGNPTGRSPRAAWDGTRWWVAYWKGTFTVPQSPEPGISVVRITTAGSVQDPAGIAVDAAHSGFQSASAISGVSGGGVRVAWQDTRAGGNNPDDIYRVTVSASGTPGAPGCVSLGAPSQSQPAIARGATGSMVAFASDVSGSRRIMAHPVDATGNALLPEPVQLAAGPFLSDPAVAWNGAVFLVVWSDEQGNRVYGRRMLANGTILDPSPITVMPGNTPHVASLGGDFLVVGSHSPLNPQFRFIYSRRVRGSDGALLDPAPVQIGGSYGIRPRAAALSDRWIVTWMGFFSHDDPHAGVQVAFVGAGGVPGLAYALSTPTMYNYSPDVAASADTALVMWQDPRVSNADWNVYAKRILRDGSELDGPGFAVTTAPNDQFMPALAWNGNTFVAAFGDRRARTFFLDGRSDVYAARVDALGGLLDPDGLAVFADTLPEKDPAVAAEGFDAARIGAAVYMDHAPYAAFRIATRTLDPPPVLAVPGLEAGALALRAAPNPAHLETAVQFVLPVAGPAKISLFDVSGRLVRRLLDRVMPAGSGTVRWTGEDESGRSVQPGVYLLRLEAGGTTRHARIVRL